MKISDLARAICELLDSWATSVLSHHFALGFGMLDKLRSVLVVALAVSYVAWAAQFITRTSIETSDGRYFCPLDDAMVSLRYAWNLGHGDGLVWNPGERVEHGRPGLGQSRWSMGGA